MRKTSTSSTFGIVTRQREFSGLKIYDVSLPRGLTLNHHIHRMAQMCIVLEGSYLEEARSQQRILMPGAVLFRPADEMHRNTVGNKNARTLLIEFDAVRNSSFQLNNLVRNPIYFLPGVLWDSMRDLESEMESSIAAEGIILLMIARATRILGRTAQPKLPVWLEQARYIIQRSYKEKIRLSWLASEVRVHPVTLALAYRHHFGTSVEQSILRLRLMKARGLLLENKLSLSEIASALGFYDQSHFGKAFKREHSVSPGAFRRATLTKSLPNEP